jgi:hypothetical protein
MKRGRVWTSLVTQSGRGIRTYGTNLDVPQSIPLFARFPAIGLVHKNLMPVKSLNRLFLAKVKSYVCPLPQCDCRKSLTFPPPPVWATLSERGIGGPSANAVCSLVPHFRHMAK